jgi:chromosome segregation ATPase
MCPDDNDSKMTGSCCSNSPDTKLVYVGNMEEKLRDLGAKIDQLSERAGEKYEQLKVKREAAQAKLNQMKSHSGEAYAEFKNGMDKAFEELQKAWDEAKGAAGRATAKLNQS